MRGGNPKKPSENPLLLTRTNRSEDILKVFLKYDIIGVNYASRGKYK